MASGQFTAFFDACTFYPEILRNPLVRLGTTGLFRAKWTEQIHEEWISAVNKNLGICTKKLRRTADLMNVAVLDCLVTNYADVEITVETADPDDRHVVAAAVKARADVIVTQNLRHFRSDVLWSRFGLQVQHPDEFISHLIDLNPNVVAKTAGTHRASYKKPEFSRAEYIRALQRVELARTAARLEGLADYV